MKNITEILTALGIQIPEDKTKSLPKTTRPWRTITSRS